MMHVDVSERGVGPYLLLGEIRGQEQYSPRQRKGLVLLSPYFPHETVDAASRSTNGEKLCDLGI